jgi:hypothetical protein
MRVLFLLNFCLWMVMSAPSGLLSYSSLDFRNPSYPSVPEFAVTFDVCAWPPLAPGRASEGGERWNDALHMINFISNIEHVWNDLAMS